VHQPAAKSIPLSSGAITVARRLDALAIGVLVLAGVIAAATFRDYGLGWDDYTHSEYGDLLVSLYSSGFADKRALSFVNLYMYGGGFDLLSALAAKILPFGLFETRRLVGAAIGIVGLLVAWRLGRRLGGPLAGLIGLVLLASCPLYYGHMFINAKDGPFAVTASSRCSASCGRSRNIRGRRRRPLRCAASASASPSARASWAALRCSSLAAAVVHRCRPIARKRAEASARGLRLVPPRIPSGNNIGLSGHGPGMAVERRCTAQSVSCRRIFFQFFRKTVA